MPSIWLQSRAYDPYIAIDRCYPLVCAGLQELGGDDLFAGENDAVSRSDTDAGAAVLHRFNGVFDLKVASIGGEDGVGEVIAGADRGLGIFSRGHQS